jgi:predicted transcriptional regulator
MDAIPEFRRDVLVSIRPIYVSRILEGRKTVELRRKFPEASSTGALALIYSSGPVSAVVGRARIKHVLRLPVSRIWKEYGVAACISRREFDSYFFGLKHGFAILFEDITPLKRELKAVDLKAEFGIVPPQSYRYLSDECIALLNDERFQAPNRYKRRHRSRRPSTFKHHSLNWFGSVASMA